MIKKCIHSSILIRIYSQLCITSKDTHLVHSVKNCIRIRSCIMKKKMHMIIYNDWYIDTILIMIWKYTLASKMNTSKKCTQSWSEGHKYWFYYTKNTTVHYIVPFLYSCWLDVSYRVVLQGRDVLQVPVPRHSALENGARSLSAEQWAASGHHRHRTDGAKIFIN